MSKKKKLIPDLRFPEFKKEGEWKLEELGEISEIVRGGSPRPIQDYLTTSDDSLNWLKIADVPSDSKYITGTKEKVIKEALSSTREVNPGDLILSNSMSFGRPYILKIKTCIHDGWIAIRKISKITFEDYLYYFISSESSQSYFNSNAAGAAVKNLNADIIKLLPIHYPSNKKEQQKIASCLSSLDDVIEAHSQKLDLLKNHKKGLMQNLFPQEGEKVPRYRFKEFKKDGNWVEKTLGEVGDFIGGGTPDTFIQEYWDGEILWYTPTEVKNGKLKSSIRKISKQGLKNSSAKLLPKGTILITTRATIGDGAITEVECTTNQGFQSLIVNNSELNSFWLYWLLHHKEELVKRASGSTFKEIGKNEIINIPTLSPQKREQQKIASCLSALDELITAQTEKIEQLKRHKKGLMQGLFPKMND